MILTAAEARDLWIKELRNTIKKQGTKVLHAVEGRNHTYCCLGIACELAIKCGIKLTKTKVFATINQKDVIVYNAVGISSLPEEVKEWLGLRNRLGSFIEKKKIAGRYVQSLAEANDKGCTFKEIADFLELNPVGVFST